MLHQVVQTFCLLVQHLQPVLMQWHLRAVSAAFKLQLNVPSLKEEEYIAQCLHL